MKGLPWNTSLFGFEASQISSSRDGKPVFCVASAPLIQSVARRTAPDESLGCGGSSSIKRLQEDPLAKIIAEN
jgi:hypothetical protein